MQENFVGGEAKPTIFLNFKTEVRKRSIPNIPTVHWAGHDTITCDMRHVTWAEQCLPSQ